MFIRKPKPWEYNEDDDAVPRDPVPNPYDHTNQEWRFRGNRCIFRHEQAVEAGESTAKSTAAGGFDKVACGAFTLGRCEVSTECPLSHTVPDDVIVAPKIAIGSKSITVDIMKAYELQPDIDSATDLMEKIHQVNYPAIRGILLRDFDVLVCPGTGSMANDNLRRQLNHTPDLPGYHDTSKMYSATYRVSARVFSAVWETVKAVQSAFSHESRHVDFAHYPSTNHFIILTLRSLDSPAYSSVKRFLDGVLKGEILKSPIGQAVWNPFLGNTAAAPQLMSPLEQKYGVVFQCVPSQKTLRVYGSPEKVKDAQKAWKDVGMPLNHPSVKSIKLDDQSLTWILTGGFEAISDAIGSESVMFNTLSTPKTVEILGPSRLCKTAETILSQRKRVPQSTKDRCSICLRKAEDPISANSGHFFCLACFESYCLSNFGHTNGGILTCPAEGATSINSKIDVNATEIEITREVPGARVTFGPGAAVMKVVIQQELLAVKIGRLPPKSTPEFVSELLSRFDIRIPANRIQKAPDDAHRYTHEMSSFAVVHTDNPELPKIIHGKLHADDRPDMKDIDLSKLTVFAWNPRGPREPGGFSHHISSRTVIVNWPRPMRNVQLRFRTRSLAIDCAKRFNEGDYKVLGEKVSMGSPHFGIPLVPPMTLHRMPDMYIVRLLVPVEASAQDVLKSMPHDKLPDDLEMEDTKIDLTDDPSARGWLESSLKRFGTLETELTSKLLKTTGRYEGAVRFKNEADARQAIAWLCWFMPPYDDSGKSFTSADRFDLVNLYTATYRLSQKVLGAVWEDFQSMQRSFSSDKNGVQFDVHSPCSHQEEEEFLVLILSSKSQELMAETKKRIDTILEGHTLGMGDDDSIIQERVLGLQHQDIKNLECRTGTRDLKPMGIALSVGFATITERRF
ncbi:ariadne ring protein [Colletotrichum chrysophilum]|uniref:Ariadne ring protein n=1 Tax=Colletotrichum chrysophilum TaxID=1836956 RepID=A0AAD9AKZ8_9PEZI|nr:ariadne ring protein [Colletotrichum chrysophilum]